MRNGIGFRQILITSLLCMAVQSQPACLGAPIAADNQISTPISDKWALVIGVSSFAHPAMNLKYAAKDAADFRDFLITKCHFAPDHIKLLTNEQATKDRILDVLGDSWLPRVTMPDDLVLIFISSHGSPSNMDVAGINYLVAYDTNPDKLFTTGIPIQHLADTIKERVHSKRVLIIMDACHSGGASESSKGIVRVGNVDAAIMAQGTGQAVMCSSSKSESSWEAKNEPNGVFTKALMESLQSHGDKTKLGEAFSLLRDKVQRQVVTERGVMQTPVLEASRWKGEELVLALPPAKPRPAPALPDEAPPNPPAAQTPAPVMSTPGMSGIGEAAPAVNRIPDLSGDFAGSNGLTYHHWQRGRKYGWAMPMLGMTGSGTISEDGKTLDAHWIGTLNGHCKCELVCDESGRVIKIISDNGTILTRVDFDK